MLTKKEKKKKKRHKIFSLLLLYSYSLVLFIVWLLIKSSINLKILLSNGLEIKSHLTLMSDNSN